MLLVDLPISVHSSALSSPLNFFLPAFARPERIIPPHRRLCFPTTRQLPVATVSIGAGGVWIRGRRDLVFGRSLAQGNLRLELCYTISRSNFTTIAIFLSAILACHNLCHHPSFRLSDEVYLVAGPNGG